ncbi:MAG TPA: acyl-CoA dehydrogenase family protein [Steroidobacteraceae bacterium]|nr:acyl-CoA dehydrogenase family protein [Steroidobacteraceae bacterium]
MIARTIFRRDHEQFRNMVSAFAQKQVIPHLLRWDEEGAVDRDFWRTCGELGILCPTMPEDYGGAGVDRLFSMIVLEELAPLGGLGISLSMHSDIVAPYLLSFGSDAVKRDCLPRMATGEMIGALAISEPGAGSDVKAVRTTAVKVDGGYLVNGSKIFISNGFECGVAVVVAKTDPGADAKGISLFAVESSMPGFEKGRKLKKIGLKAQDTAELFFKDVFVPTSHLLGEENKGFGYLMHELPWERLQIAIAAVASGEAALNLTIDYARERRAFRKPVLDFQNTRFKLAELKSEIQIAQVFVDRCMELALKNELDPTTAAMAKYWCTDLQCKVVDECMQFHGGYGFMQEYAIARAWVDARAQKIYGGTNEIMKDIISRGL